MRLGLHVFKEQVVPLSTTALNNAKRSAVKNADNRAGTGADCGGLLKMAGIYGVLRYHKQAR